MKILIIDNFDSFTFNLYQLVGEIMESQTKNFEVRVLRNDASTLTEIIEAKYDRILISPGPGTPENKKYFGVCTEVLKTISRTIPTLGVCLGMQGIAYCYGGRLMLLSAPVHGKTSVITHKDIGIFKNIPQDIEVMRYHSIIVKSLPKCLVATAHVKGEGNEIMGIRHKNFPIFGVQFHPESFATECGKKILENFLLGNYNEGRNII